jgi:ribosomal protein L11 methyltransferase
MKSWPALAVRFAPDVSAGGAALEDLVSAALDDLRATAIQETEERWLVFFAGREDRDRAAAALPAVAPARLQVDPIDVPDEDWARRSQQALTPVRVGRFVIAPPWAAAGAAPLARGGTATGETTLVIQPSMGFGTGHHASTRLCTTLLQRLDLAGRTVLDVGTGSGVLALVAYALGAAAVTGVDDDPDAIASARENLALNGVTTGVDLREGDFRAMPDVESDVVVANLTGGLLIRGADVLAGAVAAGGSLVVSGVLRSEEADVVAAFAPRLTVVDRLSEDEWIGAILTRAAGRDLPTRTAAP